MSLYTIRSGVDNHPEDSVLQSLTDLVRKGGLIKPSADLVVDEPTSGLNVSIGAGHALLKGASTNAYPVRNTTSVDVAISANSSGNPRYTAVVLYIDLSVVPVNTDAGDDVALFKTVDGSPAGSPTAPDDSAIQSSVGAGNPFLRLANVYVVNGATGISSGDITNIGQRVFIQSPTPIHTFEYSATVTMDYLNGSKQRTSLTGNITFNAPSNMEVGDMIKISLVQAGSGSYTVTWFSGITWLSPDITLATPVGDLTEFAFEKTGTASYTGWLVGKEY